MLPIEFCVVYGIDLLVVVRVTLLIVLLAIMGYIYVVFNVCIVVFYGFVT